MVEDVDGNVYLDAEAGVATASTGHCHPAVAAAIAAQAEVLIHICGTDFHYPGYGAICEKLGALAQRIGPNAHHWQTFLTNSGTEAVEAAIKLARHHTGRPGLIAFRGGFHGRTLGLAVADRQQVEVPAALRPAAARRVSRRPTATPPASRSCSRP